MIRRPPRSTRTDTLFPTRRSSDLFAHFAVIGRMITVIGVQPARPARMFGDEEQALRFAQMIGQPGGGKIGRFRSEEHTSELQSLMRISYAVVCLKKKSNLNRHMPSTRVSTIVISDMSQSIE